MSVTSVQTLSVTHSHTEPQLLYISIDNETRGYDTAVLFDGDICTDKTRWAIVNSPVPGAESPVGRHSHSAIIHRRRMWVYGGLSGLTALGDLWTWHFGQCSAQDWKKTRLFNRKK